MAALLTGVIIERSQSRELTHTWHNSAGEASQVSAQPSRCNAVYLFGLIDCAVLFVDLTFCLYSLVNKQDMGEYRTRAITWGM